MKPIDRIRQQQAALQQQPVAQSPTQVNVGGGDMSKFLPPRLAISGGRKLRRLLMSFEGETDSGKTEFALGSPGPIRMIALDRNFDAVFDNPNPPLTRTSEEDMRIKVVQAPIAMQFNDKSAYAAYWMDFYRDYVAALSASESECRSVIIDGDSDGWELQRLAEFGTLTQVAGPPGIAYTGVQAARRAMITRAWDSGKIVIYTNKLKAEYGPIMHPDGTYEKDKNGQIMKERTGKFIRQGFADMDYKIQVQLLNMKKPAHFNERTKKTVPMQWGVKILKSKANMALEGEELWGNDCNMRTLLEFIYPNVAISEWGFKD